jgi:hypothetical protein
MQAHTMQRYTAIQSANMGIREEERESGVHTTGQEEQDDMNHGKPHTVVSPIPYPSKRFTKHPAPAPEAVLPCDSACVTVRRYACYDLTGRIGCRSLGGCDENSASI